ncbi:HAD-IIB family hydrolase [Metamycoplasma gateae]|uniref:HAD-IIB family hydrolase n=1 Tax=Metamycoplasma gateae TaxID=35769 RepID=A0ABZ2AHP2_9BACT|nr:HAD-IIB family hydrolase [Metamycoplasma gateae]
MYSITNNKKPIIFSDVDGTIYKKFDLKENTVKDIQFAIKNDADFNICTGNPVRERMLELAEKLDVKYLLCSSGGQIYDVKKQQHLKSWYIDYKFLKDLIDVANRLNLQMIFWDDDNYFYLKDSPNLNNEILNYHFISKEKQETIPKKYSNELINPIKIEIYSQQPINECNISNKVNEIYKEIEFLNDDIEIIVTHCNIEINAKNINKGSAIKWLIENEYNDLDVKLEDVMTIGDSNNDIPMLQLTNYSYAMANSTEKPLKIAKLFTSDVVQNGLGEAILDYLYRLKNIARKHMLHEFLEGEK